MNKLYKRLGARGRFIQAQSAETLERDVLAASDPFAAMALELFVPDPNGSVVKSVSYARFEAWCFHNHRNDIFRSVPDNRFGNRLRAFAGFDYQPHGQPRVWLGIRLRPKADGER